MEHQQSNLIYEWLNRKPNYKNTVTLDTMGQISVRRRCLSSTKKQYFCHDTADGEYMHEVMCPCILKQVGLNCSLIFFN